MAYAYEEVADEQANEDLPLAVFEASVHNILCGLVVQAACCAYVMRCVGRSVVQSYVCDVEPMML